MVAEDVVEDVVNGVVRADGVAEDDAMAGTGFWGHRSGLRLITSERSCTRGTRLPRDIPKGPGLGDEGALESPGAGDTQDGTR